MELTRENYYEVEPIILKDIENSEFIAFDLEFSGIIISKFKIYDSSEEYFQKSKYMAENYRIIQVGITPFIKKDVNNNKEYIAKPYNIYAFPSEKQSNNRFDSCLASIIFNREHGCDFNKWISQGVPYLNNENLKKLTERLMSGNINKYDPKNISTFKNIVLYKEQDKIRYKDFHDTFMNFYNNKEEKILKHEKIVRHLMLYFLNKLDEDIRKKIFIEYKDEIVGEDVKSYIFIHKLNSYEEKLQKINQENNEIIALIKREKGIKNLIEKIISSKKPIVGHNCFIDLLFIMSHFMDDIPKNFHTFKLKLKNEFGGGIYDTKYLFSSNKKNINELNIKDYVNLECLYTNLYEKNEKLEKNQKIIVEIPKNEKFINYFDENEKNKENKEKKFHQADYDSLTTGCVYLYLKNILGEKSIKDGENKLNCYYGLYQCFDLNNLNKEEKYYDNSSDAYILLFNEKLYENNEIRMKINEEVIESKYINSKINAKEIGGAYIILINSNNKNNFIEVCSKYKNYINIKTIEEYKESLKNKIINK